MAKRKIRGVKVPKASDSPPPSCDPRGVTDSRPSNSDLNQTFKG
jgi:hypothetical protein